jgi:hypothetical protein
LGDLIKEDGMGEACCSHGRVEKMHTVFRLLNLIGRDNSEDVGVDGRIILEWILGKQGGKLWTGYI